MTSITIRNVPEATRNELAARAAVTGRSLQEYLLARLVEMAEQTDAEAWVARVRASKAAMSGPGPTIEQILAARDSGRR
jgi:plasmid stability protein